MFKYILSFPQFDLHSELEESIINEKLSEFLNNTQPSSDSSDYTFQGSGLEEETEEEYEDETDEVFDRTKEDDSSSEDEINNPHSEKKKSSMIIEEKVNVEDLKNQNVGEKINAAVNLFRTGIPSKGDVSINVCLEYSGNDCDEEENIKEEKVPKRSKRRKLFHLSTYEPEMLMSPVDVKKKLKKFEETDHFKVQESLNNEHNMEEYDPSNDILDEEEQENGQESSDEKQYIREDKNDFSLRRMRKRRHSELEKLAGGIKEDEEEPLRKKIDLKQTPGKLNLMKRRYMLKRLKAYKTMRDQWKVQAMKLKPSLIN